MIKIIFIVIFLLKLSIVIADDNQFEIVRYQTPYYILKVNPELNYFVNGYAEVTSKKGSYQLFIKDTNNLNDLILVKEDQEINLVESCKDNGCKIIPKHYEDANKDNGKGKEYEKDTFLGTAFAINHSYTNPEGDLDANAGLGVTFDFLIYKYPIGSLNLSFGLSSNMIYSNYQLKGKAFSDQYGNEKVHLVNFSSAPSLFINLFETIRFFGGISTHYMYVLYALERENVSYSLSGGLSFGTTFGVIFSFGNAMISLRSLSNSVEIAGESNVNGNAQEFVEKLSSNLMLVSVGFSF